MKTNAYDLEERRLEYSARIIRAAEQIVSTTAGGHVARQVLRSGTAALPNHGEAQAADAKRDFVHKMKLCLKEPRETLRRLRLVQRVPLVKSPARIDPLAQETAELIRIFVSSIRTAQRPAA